MKTKTKQKVKILLVTISFIIVSSGVAFTVLSITLVSIKIKNAFDNPIGDTLDNLCYDPQIVKEWLKQKEIEGYKYNDQIPVEVVKAEIAKQAKAFGNDVQFMLSLAKCESTFNNLSDNPTSTAKGIYQFVALTWEVTESNKNKISEFDYIANIREANIKIANGEYSHWVECLD